MDPAFATIFIALWLIVWIVWKMAEAFWGPHANTDLREVYLTRDDELERLRRARRPSARQVLEEADRRLASGGSVGCGPAQDAGPEVAAGCRTATGEVDLPPGVPRPAPTWASYYLHGP